MTRPGLRDLLAELWPHLPPRHRRFFAPLFALAVCTAFAEILTLGALYPFMMVLVAPDRAADSGFTQRFLGLLPAHSRSDLLWLLTAVFVLAVLVATVLRIVLLFAQTIFVNRLGSALSIEVYRRTLHQPYRVHVARNSSEVIAAIAGKVNGVVSSVIMPIIVGCSSAIILVAVMVSLLAVNPLVAFAMLGGFAGIYSLVALGVKARLSREGKVAAEQGVVVIKALQEGLGGIRDILIDGTQEVFCRVYRDADYRGRSAQAVITFISNLPRSVIEGLGMMLIAGIAYLLAVRSDDPGGAIPVLGVIALGVQRILPLVQGLYAGWSTITGHTQALREVLALLSQPMLAADPAGPRNALALPFRDAIALEAVGFAYHEDASPVLQGVDLVIPKGCRLGVIGATGSGKSTLIDLLLGLLEPSQGRITIDGVPLDASHLRAWQQRVAHVPQSIFLVDASVAENIAFGLPLNQIDMARVKEAAARAQIDAAIEAMPRGYATRIGERGVQLSGGQRQRIGIARALYKRAEVLILDEATSALDNQTEAQVMKAMGQLDADLTIVMIAHRLTSLSGCTLIVEVAEGRVRAIGGYAALIDRKGGGDGMTGGA